MRIRNPACFALSLLVVAMAAPLGSCASPAPELGDRREYEMITPPGESVPLGEVRAAIASGAAAAGWRAVQAAEGRVRALRERPGKSPYIVDIYYDATGYSLLVSGTGGARDSTFASPGAELDRLDLAIQRALPFPVQEMAPE